MLLSFAVGGLLGDVFLHLLPEAWENKSLNSSKIHYLFYKRMYKLRNVIHFGMKKYETLKIIIFLFLYSIIRGKEQSTIDNTITGIFHPIFQND